MATITDEDRKAAKLILFAGGPSVRQWIELGTGDFPERIAQAIADARERATLAERTACVEWVRDAEGDGVAEDLAAARRAG
jgi:hypothetical protein